MLSISHQSCGEHGLEIGFIKARKCPTTISGLHLRRGDDLSSAVFIGIGTAVEAAQLVIEDSRESDINHGCARK